MPTAIKRTLTTLQITQFLIGASYAMVHSFVYYTVPVHVPVGDAAEFASSTPAAAAAAETARAAGGFLDSVKQAVLGAAAPAAASPPAVASVDGVAYQIQQRAVPCITTAGQTFAIWLNVLYLAPLTYLFVSFFIASYIKRSNAEAQRSRVEKKMGSTRGETEAERRLSNAMLNAEKAGWDAARGIEKEVYGQGGESAIVDDDDEVEAAPRQQHLAVPTQNGSSRTLRSRTKKV